MPRRHRVVKEDTPRRGGGIFRLFRIVRACIAVAVILYISVLIASRTNGFSALVADRLESRVGLPVHIERSSCNARLDLTLKGVNTADAGKAGAPSVRASKAKLSWSWRGLMGGGGPAVRAIELEDASIAFAIGSAATWEPAPLVPLAKRLAKWLELDLDRHAPGGGGHRAASTHDAPAAKPVKLDGVALRLTDGRIAWWAGADQELARVDGIQLDSTPIDLPNRKVTHRYLRVAEVATKAGPAMRNLVLEVMESDGQQLIMNFRVDRLSPSVSGSKPSGERTADGDAG